MLLACLLRGSAWRDLMHRPHDARMHARSTHARIRTHDIGYALEHTHGAGAGVLATDRVTGGGWRLASAGG